MTKRKFSDRYAGAWSCAHKIRYGFNNSLRIKVEKMVNLFIGKHCILPVQPPFDLRRVNLPTLGKCPSRISRAFVQGEWGAANVKFIPFKSFERLKSNL